MFSWTTIAGILGGIVLIGNAGNMISKWIKPAFVMRGSVEEHEDEIKTLKKHEENDFETLNHITEVNKAMCESMLCMMNHMIDGNHVEQMKETRNKLQDLLTKI